jgi:hypothetical protein
LKRLGPEEVKVEKRQRYNPVEVARHRQVRFALEVAGFSDLSRQVVRYHRRLRRSECVTRRSPNAGLGVIDSRAEGTEKLFCSQHFRTSLSTKSFSTARFPVLNRLSINIVLFVLVLVLILSVIFCVFFIVRNF